MRALEARGARVLGAGRGVNGLSGRLGGGGSEPGLPALITLDLLQDCYMLSALAPGRKGSWRGARSGLRGSEARRPGLLIETSTARPYADFLRLTFDSEVASRA